MQGDTSQIQFSLTSRSLLFTFLVTREARSLSKVTQTRTSESRSHAPSSTSLSCARCGAVPSDSRPQTQHASQCSRASQFLASAGWVPSRLRGRSCPGVCPSCWGLTASFGFPGCGHITQTSPSSSRGGLRVHACVQTPPTRTPVLLDGAGPTSPPHLNECKVPF